ncbi:hypothetical protein VTJ83DRAFT_4804 [Remersonia thermophila]|uniref:Uncharacterized protein n=1 Tax=Remersonia thermophila TaxID=72144 RepID=A0ABR4DD68_9PEZI
MAGPAVVAMAGSREPVLDAAENGPLASSLSADELVELREYGKLLRFRDTVLSGSHPRIKPPHLSAKPAHPPKSQSSPASSSAISSSAAPGPSRPITGARAVDSRQVADHARAAEANRQPAKMTMSVVPGLSTIASGSSGQQRAPESGRPRIDPVLLEKSDDLIKAEIQLQRQRIERSLKEQLDQRRPANKASEQFVDLDVADVLAKAMSLVQSTSAAAAPPTATTTPAAQSTDDTAANASASIENESDNDTFYSSRHDTPDSAVMASRLPDESADEEMREGSPYEPELDLEPSVPPGIAPAAPSGVPQPQQQQQQQQRQQQQQQANVTRAIPTASTIVVPGLSISASTSTRASQSQVTETSVPTQAGGDGARAEPTSQAGAAQISGVYGAVRRDRSPGSGSGEPLVRNHDLSPVAPQPTHLVPAAITREPQPSAAGVAGVPQAAPAQVTALRNQPSNGSSPESSPHSGKAFEKKGGKKKKKRKADRLAGDAGVSQPYIKPEPRSPSPLTPQYARPNKRQRQSQGQATDIQDEEPRYDQRMPAEQGTREDGYQPRVIREERAVGYERPDGYRPRYGDEPVLVTSPRYERVYYQDYRPPPPPPRYPEPDPYAPSHVRMDRATSRIVEAPYDDGATYYRHVQHSSRVSMRPSSHRGRSQSPVAYERPTTAMPPPRAPPRRIIVDENGREYLEPVRPAPVVREEVVVEQRGPYERIPPPSRAISRRPEPYDDEATLYRPASPGYAHPRRVVTQPEYYREATSNPPPRAPVEYLPSRPEPPREYISRPSSVRSVYERYPPPPPPPPPSALRDYYRAASVYPAAPAAHDVPPPPAARYEVPAGYEHQPPPDYPPPPPRPASVRPTVTAETLAPVSARYDGYAPPPRRIEYASPPIPPAPAGYPAHHAEGRVEYVPPPPPPASAMGTRGYSAAPQGEHVVRREYAPPSYYGRAPPPMPPPQQQQQGREDDEVVYLNQAPLVREYR